MNARFLFPVLLTILFISCEANVDLQNVSDEVSLHPDLIVPIGGDSVTLSQLIANNDTLGRLEIGDDAEINYVILDSSKFTIPSTNLFESSKKLLDKRLLTPDFTQQAFPPIYGTFNPKLKISTLYKQSIDLIKSPAKGLLKLSNPQIYITTISNIGTYLNFSIDSIKAYLKTTPTLNPVYANFDGSKSATFELKRRPETPGDTINYKLRTIDKDWGRTDLIFENSPVPDMLQYSFSVFVDSTLNNQSTTPSFITSDAYIKVNIKTVIPLSFSKGSYYEYGDSIKNFFKAVSNSLDKYPYNDITYADLILNITNGLPVKSTFTFHLTDSVGNVLPTSFKEEYAIAAGKVDSTGIVQPGQETKQTVQVIMTKDQLDTLKKARAFIYKVRIEGSDLNSNIHFIKSNLFNLKVGLFIKGDINTTI